MRVPNKCTQTTLEKSERGEELHRAKDADDLFDQLDI
jgi:DNA-damage-inducible protein J